MEGGGSRFLISVNFFRNTQAKRTFFAIYMYGKSYFKKIAIGKPAQWLVKAAASIGLDYSGLTHEVTSCFASHVIKRHGHGKLAITKNDFEKIPVIVKSPDMAIIGAKRKGGFFNGYAKRIGGKTYLYFDEVLSSNRNKALRSQTFYKITKELDMNGFIKIITMNGRSDISKAKKI